MNARPVRRFASILGLMLLTAAGANAVFVAPYSTWTVAASGTTAPSVESLFVDGNSTSATQLRLTTPNQGTAGEVRLTSRPLLPSTATFSWTYSSADTAANRKNHDVAGYVLNGAETIIARNGDKAFPNFTIDVKYGDTLTFFARSTDGINGSGTWTITNLSGNLAAVPEASAYLTLAFTGLVVVGVAVRRRKTQAAGR